MKWDVNQKHHRVLLFFNLFQTLRGEQFIKFIEFCQYDYEIGFDQKEQIFSFFYLKSTISNRMRTRLEFKLNINSYQQI